ncbi:MAG: prolyl oligopeptidase family serine peptidase [Myxococcales bacterium]
MRMLSILLALASACASGKTSTAPAATAGRAPVPLEEYYKIRRYGGTNMTFSHDEKLVVFATDQGGRLDLWARPVEGGEARQITHVEGFLGAFAFSPTDDVLAYEADVSGDELPHLFLTDSKGGAPRDVTADYPKGRRTQFLDWARDGKSFVYLSNLRDEKLFDLCEYDLASGHSQILWLASGALTLVNADRAHNRFAILETLSDANNNLWMFERGEEHPVLLTPHEGDVLYMPQDFTTDAGGLLYTADEGGEFSSLHEMDLTSKKSKPLLQPKWDVDAAADSIGHRYRYATVNADGTEELSLWDLSTGKDMTVPQAPMQGGWVPAGFSPHDRYLGVWLRTDAAPFTPYVLDLQTGEARKLDDPLPPSLAGRKMVTGESVRVQSFDGKDLPGFLYRATGTPPYPAIIDVHGGPTSQSLRSFSAYRQYFLSKGISVFVPNVRGSTGYGKTWMRLDNKDLGGGPLKDIVACKWWLVANADVADDKVLVMGGSYGGYMALAAEAFAPEEFVANVDYFGVSDLKTLVTSFPPYWAAFSTFLYQKFGNPADPKDAAYQHDRSPINFTAQMKRPLLVVQGDHDARVKKDQSDRIVESLRARKVPVHYLVLENEGHGFSRTDSLLRAIQATDAFIDRYVFGDAKAQVPGG